jgi:tRNA pseudouridine38-40 synthase
VNARVIRVRLEYDGTGFAGWQVQPGRRTVQGEVEEALRLLTGESVRVHAAGRTDAGVHALGQEFSFQTRSSVPGEAFGHALNRYLPPDVVAKRSSEEPAGFHARKSAVRKLYRYAIVLCRGRRPYQGRFAWELWPPPDVDRMRAAARPLEGTHDFAAFAASGRKPGSTVRTLDQIGIEQRGTPHDVVGGDETGSESEAAREAELVLTFSGDGFLYKMVRNIVGTLVEIGQGKRPPGDTAAALTTCERQFRGQTAPAKGLTLVRVEYAPRAPRTTQEWRT